MAKDEILELLPGVVDTLTVHVAAGHSFDHAVYELTNSEDHALSRAFGLYLQEVKEAREAGRREGIRREALLRMARRLDVPELSEFVDALIESDEKGISLLETLKRSSARLRGSP
jgi:tight adherence protein C